MNKLELNCKIWLKHRPKVFRDRPCDILERVESTGSLRQAAAQINMSYSQAWRLIRSLETRLGCSLLIRRAGGEQGGGSLLTVQARELIWRYRFFRHAAQLALQGVFQEHFNDGGALGRWD